jgi:hypothetical protein
MDQQFYNYLRGERDAGRLGYDDAMAFDAAQSRGEFAPYGGEPASAASPGDTQPPQTPPDAMTGTGLQTGSNPVIPTQKNVYEPAQLHSFATDLGLPPLPPGEQTEHPDLRRIQRYLTTEQPIGPLLRSMAGVVRHTPGALAAQLGSTPEEQDVYQYLADNGIPALIGARLLGRSFRGVRLLGR